MVERVNEETNRPAVVRIAGAQDIATRNDLTIAFQRVRDNPHVIVDLTESTYLDSAAIGELFRAEQRARALEGRLIVVAPSERIVRLLSIAGLTSSTQVVETLDAAHALLR